MTTGDNDFYYSLKVSSLAHYYIFITEIVCCYCLALQITALFQYEDDEFEYRHVHITKDCIPLVPRNHLMTETEWRSIGIQQSQGWFFGYTYC